jgi:hypothetical protein
LVYDFLSAGLHLGGDPTPALQLRNLIVPSRRISPDEHRRAGITIVGDRRRGVMKLDVELKQLIVGVIGALGKDAFSKANGRARAMVSACDASVRIPNAYEEALRVELRRLLQPQ